MPRKKAITTDVIENIPRSLINVMPLLQKHFLHMEAIRNEHSISLSQMQVLSMLGETGFMSLSEISHRMGTYQSNISPMVDRLVEDGLVERVRDTLDRRVVSVVILDAGREKLAAIQSSIGEQVWEWAQGGISAADIRDLGEVLGKLARILPLMQEYLTMGRGTRTCRTVGRGGSPRYESSGCPRPRCVGQVGRQRYHPD